MDKIKEVDFKKATEMQKESAELEREVSNFIGRLKHIAKLRRASYEAHIAEGFTQAEALELCKKITL